ncbi:circadian clock KaiB family protein [Pedobacter psychroterrae]|uniref:Circadian clock protein KaiB n=1 Tax=Pedobacter psychroterrae TaxID=2530453 RepID=A0A4R0NCK7_9SPHI|nr:circadian clock KaiB family protein [Pedobacter psychroterrae]TCC98060.1 circadian clock protein KaiB [Pedobacter psychroterrae]
MDFSEKEYYLILFITGASPNSVRAISNIKSICEKYLKGNYILEIVDVYKSPEIAQKEQIVALPTLIKKKPEMERRLVGDMSETEKVMRGLGILS